MANKFYVTTPIYYVNANPHLGHTYTTIAADVLARYHRMIGDKTFFLTGTDEHGEKIAEKALETGLEPQQFTDKIAASFQLAWDGLNISNDRFIRSTEAGHKQAVQRALQYMHDKGDIYLGKYEGLYCQGCEQFKNEKDLIDSLCPDHKIKPKTMNEESYMFKLSKYQGELFKKIKNDELKIRPIEKKNEMISFYENQGLQDVSFSRKKVKWGIPLPWDKTHTTYVWADALLNYLTGLNWTGAAKNYPEFWPADLQLMAKDILRVHSTIWPAMLLSLELPLPKQLFIHGFFLTEGQKMSKSLGNVITPEQLNKKYQVDGVRYLLMSATPFGNDGDISWDKFDKKYNADLANGLGNLVSRVVTMTLKLESQDKLLGKPTKELISQKEIDNYCQAIGDIALGKAVSIIWEVIRSCDKYLDDTKPWKTMADAKSNAGQVLASCLETLRIVAFLIWPFMPEASEKIWTNLGLEPSKEMREKFVKVTKWRKVGKGIEVKKETALFPRI